MVSDSKRADKFLIKYAPIESRQQAGDFAEQFGKVEAQARELRLKCVMADGSTVVLPNDAPMQPAFSRNPSMADTTPTLTTDHFARPVSTTPPQVVTTLPPLPPSTSTLSSNQSNGGEVEAELRNSRAKIQQLLARNGELVKQVDDLKRTLLLASNTTPSSDAIAAVPETSDLAKEWNTLVESQKGVPPVLLVLVAIFCFLLGLLF